MLTVVSLHRQGQVSDPQGREAGEEEDSVRSSRISPPPHRQLCVEHFLPTGINNSTSVEKIRETDMSNSKGRAKKRLTYTRRFVNVVLTGGKRKVSSTLPPQAL